MAEIRVEIRDFTDNTLGNLDIISSDDFPLSLSFQNFDVRDFNSRSGSFSKTFTVPATKNNNILFNQIYKDGNVDRRNVRKDLPSTIYVDNLPIITGKIRVSRVTKTQKPLEYECIFLGDNMDWASAIKDLDLKDLKFSNNSYTDYSSIIEGGYTFQNIHGVDSNLTDNPADHTDYSYTQDKILYPLASYGEGVSNIHQVTEGDFAPAFYLKSIWDKIFQAQGYTVSSEFCNSDYFKSLIVPFDFERKAEQNNNKFGQIKRTQGYVQSQSYFDQAGTTTSGSYIGTGLTLNRRNGTLSYNGNNPYARFLFSGTSTTDDANLDVDTDGTGNVQKGTHSSGDLGSTMLVKNLQGTHSIDFSITARFFRTETDFKGDFRVQGELWRVTDDNDHTAFYDEVANIQAGNQTTGGSAERLWSQMYNVVEDAPYDVDRTWSGSRLVSGVGVQKFIFVIWVDANYPSSFNGESVTFGFKEGSMEISGDTEVSIGDDLDNIQYFIPNGKQSDFIMGVSQMFNLQFKTDTAAKIVRVEPYDYFYKGFSDAVNWTEKVDYSKNIEDEFIYDIKSNLVLKYKDANNDGFLERFNKKNIIDWGVL